MIRRTLAGLLAAAVIVFAPTAATAQYVDDDFDAVVETTNPAPAEPFAVTVTAPSGTDVTLTVTADGVPDDAIQIAGTKSMTKTAVDGQAVFTVTLTEEAVHEMVATDPEGNVIETFTVAVGDAIVGGGDGDQAGGGGDGDDQAGGVGGDDQAGGPALPETGATATPLIVGGIALLVVGGVIVYLVRRRGASEA
jgi:LPXTG-motif cell wall-anchored protein